MPLVIVSGGIDSLQVDFLNFYFKCLEPHGIGMLSLDMPGTGYAEHWPLVQDTSRLHQAVLNHLSEVAWVDHQRIAMVGFRLAGNVAARLAFVEPFKLRTVVCIGAGINQVFTNQEMFARCPRMMRDGWRTGWGGRGPVGSAAHQVPGLPLIPGIAGESHFRADISMGTRKILRSRAGCPALAAASRSGKTVVFDKQPPLEARDEAPEKRR